MMGRFCHTDVEIEAQVRAHLEAEQKRRPDVTFAEICYAPAGRTANIQLRPVLRDYEITYLGSSGATAKHQIQLKDLLLSVRDRRIVLRSSVLAKEIVPRISTAHNPTANDPKIYRFLCRLEKQDSCDDLRWNWGRLSNSAFLPRLTRGRLILSRATWNLPGDAVHQLLSEEPSVVFSKLQQIRETLQLPRLVSLVEVGSELLVDFDNVLSLEAFVAQCKAHKTITLVESLAEPENLLVTGPEGAYIHELLVPFLTEHPL
jgi:hypothetical protein